MLGCHNGSSFLSRLGKVTTVRHIYLHSLYNCLQARPLIVTQDASSLGNLFRRGAHTGVAKRRIENSRRFRAEHRLDIEKKKEDSQGKAYKPPPETTLSKLQRTAKDGKWRGRIDSPDRGSATKFDRRSDRATGDNAKSEPPALENWRIQKRALERKFGDEGWNPRKKLSPDALDGIRALHNQLPDVYSTEVLANEFEVSAEAIRRILKSKWRPDEATAADRRERWRRRGEKIWSAKAEEGVKPPKPWREALGIKLQPRDSTQRFRPGLGPGSVPKAVPSATTDEIEVT